MDAAAQLVRERIDCENDLLGQRTQWLVASQAFLLTAYGTCLVGSSGARRGPHVRTVELLVEVLPWTALTSLLLLYVTVLAAVAALLRLRRILQPTDPWHDVAVNGSSVPRVAGLVAPLLVPVVFIVTWTVIIVG